MVQVWDSLVNGFDWLFPADSPRRNAIHIVSIILLVEGVSVFALFSKVALPLGTVSFALGLFMLLLIQRGQPIKEKGGDSLGLRLLHHVERFLGGPAVLMAMGVVVIVLVVIYNERVSDRPDYGDVDTITLLLGVVLVAYPILYDKYRVESSFALLFVGLVVIVLVVPQVLFSLGASGGESVIGNWYVHYMLAAPFAGVLDSIGIQASSSGDMVTMQFQDGSIHTLKISAYCAGLYSFSIFLSAFAAFILVFERLPNRTLALALVLGIIVAYLGNLLRMVVIGVVGYYQGLDALYWAHENAGWMVFLAWSSVFWWLILSYVSKPRNRATITPDGQ